MFLRESGRHLPIFFDFRFEVLIVNSQRLEVWTNYESTQSDNTLLVPGPYILDLGLCTLPRRTDVWRLAKLRDLRRLRSLRRLNEEDEGRGSFSNVRGHTFL